MAPAGGVWSTPVNDIDEDVEGVVLGHDGEGEGGDEVHPLAVPHLRTEGPREPIPVVREGTQRTGRGEGERRGGGVA